MCNVKFMASAMYGVPLLSIMLADGQAALDALCARPEVDDARIGVIGNSYGGRTSMWMTVFDERIRASVCAGCLNCFRERSLKLSSCGAQFFPGLLQWGDVQEVFALIAPRPLMLIAGTQDALLPEEWVEAMLKTIRRAYSALGADARLELLRHEGGHYIPQEAAVAWLKRSLATESAS
jgi:dienelactone hydrolase